LERSATVKRRAFLGVAGTALTGAGALSPPRSLAASSKGKVPESVENEVLDLERKWMDAIVHRDEATLAAP
jgi:hypothetical protein